jgi:hypothetical protein
MRGRPTRFGEIIVDSDFTTASALELLFIILTLMLIRDIRHFLWDAPNQIAISGTINRLGVALALVYCLVFVFRWPNRLVKIGCALFATHSGLTLALTYLRISPTAQPPVAFVSSMAMQISLVTFLIAIAHWFRTVVRWTSPSPGEGEDR